ncbi:MAG: disulfide bond formation protein B [Alphaproteobacteria bacterium]|nr:disulfide bond formation protein B [Alphaproteobacteria bacterium]
MSERNLIDVWTRPDRWPLAGGAAALALLGGAYAFEITGNYPPCPLCIEQRWIHIWATLAGVIGFALAQTLRRSHAKIIQVSATTLRESLRGWFRSRLQAAYALYQAPGALSRVASGVVGAIFAWSAWTAGRHAGMEYGWWTIDCQATDVSSVSVDSVLESLNTAANVVPCDEAAWTMLGISMAGYNALFSATLCLISIISLFRSPSWRTL